MQLFCGNVSKSKMGKWETIIFWLSHFTVIMSNCYICASENVSFWFPHLDLDFSIAAFAIVFTYFYLYIPYLYWLSVAEVQNFWFCRNILSYFFVLIWNVSLFFKWWSPLAQNRHADFCGTSASKREEFFLPSILRAEQNPLRPRGWLCSGSVLVLSSGFASEDLQWLSSSNQSLNNICLPSAF